MSSNTVIVFGATGAVGRAAAIEAHRRGSTVYLAMRDPKKEIKGIQNSESDDRYHRIQADLSQPDTVKQAIITSGAKTAFVYSMFMIPNSMRATFDAIKEAGAPHVVLLSSFTVKEPASSEVNLQAPIPALHSKIEVALQEAGVSFTAVRPAYFNSNILWAGADMKKGEVEVVYPNIKFDYIAPEDIGTVCGYLLADADLRKSAGPAIYLCGPELMTQRDCLLVAAKALGKEVSIKEIGEDRFREKMSQIGDMGLAAMLKEMREVNEGKNMYADIYDQGAKNLRTYLEREPMKLDEWAVAHKEEFA